MPKTTIRLNWFDSREPAGSSYQQGSRYSGPRSGAECIANEGGQRGTIHGRVRDRRRVASDSSMVGLEK